METRSNPKPGAFRAQAAIVKAAPSARPLRAQAAIETLTMVGFALAFMIPLALLFFTATGSEIGGTSIQQAKSTVRTISAEAGEVYLQGAGARKTILVNYPEGIQNGSVGNGMIVLTISADQRTLDITSSTFANVSGNLSGARIAGMQRINLVNIGGSYVNITYG